VDNVADGIWVTGDLLTADERTELLLLSHKKGYREAKKKAKGRHNQETFLCLPDIANKIESRLNSSIRSENVAGLSVAELSSELAHYRYVQGDYVAMHCDGSENVKDDRWSAFTLVIYLNDGFTGGATGFPTVGIELNLSAGQGVLFKQSLHHEGKVVLSGEKYILTSDVAMEGFGSLTPRAP
jgi:Poxvirus C4/C10 protein